MENITKQIEKFQSTLLREERPISRPPEDKPVEFQSTLLREERPSGSWKRKRPKRFQSTLLREERRSKHMWIMMDYFISIHAPARGATVIARCQYVSYHISIHAPARGATNSLLSVVLVEIFQSTLLREERLFPVYAAMQSEHISIHAPARGATAKITYFSQNKDLCLGNTNNTQHYPNVQAKFKYEMLPIYLLSLVRTSL